MHVHAVYTCYNNVMYMYNVMYIIHLLLLMPPGNESGEGMEAGEDHIHDNNITPEGVKEVDNNALRQEVAPDIPAAEEGAGGMGEGVGGGEGDGGAGADERPMEAEEEREEGEDEGDREREGEDEKDEGEMDLFSLSVVNAYGSQVVQTLKDDDSIALRLTSEFLLSPTLPPSPFPD